MSVVRSDEAFPVSEIMVVRWRPINSHTGIILVHIVKTFHKEHTRREVVVANLYDDEDVGVVHQRRPYHVSDAADCGPNHHWIARI